MTKVSKSAKEAPAKKESGSTKVAKPGSSSGDVVDFRGSKKLIMEALGSFYSRGVKSVSKDKLITATKMAFKTMSNTLPKLRTDGYLQTDEPKMVGLTEKGISALGDIASCGTTNEEVHDKIKADLTGKGVALFEALIDGEEYDKDALAKQLEYKDGKKTKTFINLTGQMRTSKIVDYPTPQTIALNKETCFPFDE